MASSSFTCNLAVPPRPPLCPKEFARGPPGMAIEDVPFKRAVRAGRPPHVEQYRFHRAPVIAVDPRRDGGEGSFFLVACQLLAKTSIVRSLRAMPRMAAVTRGRRINQNHDLLWSCWFRPSIRLRKL